MVVERLNLEGLFVGEQGFDMRPSPSSGRIRQNFFNPIGFIVEEVNMSDFVATQP